MSLLRLVLLVCCLAATSILAGVSQADMGAASTRLDVSVRAAGMGRASNGVFWGDGPDVWVNPSLLGYHRGVRYEYARTHLVPDLAKDVYLTTKRLTVGQWGLGFLLAGEPVEGLGESRLDYGTSVATDDQGNEVGSFASWEKIEEWGVGISVLEGLSSLLDLVGSDFPPPSRFGDLSLGYTEKEVEVSLAPSEFILDFHEAPGEGEVTTEDWGWMARLTPYDSIDYPGLIPALDEIFEPLGGLRFDLTYGRSKHNFDRVHIILDNDDAADPVMQSDRSGFAVHAALADPFSVQEWFEDGGLEFLSSSLTPFLRAGVAFDRLEIAWPYRERDIKNSGVELTVANVISARWGRINDPDGDIQGSTWGVGFGFEFEEMLGLHFDHANVPQAEGLDRVSRNAISLMVDPIAGWRYLQGDSEEP